MSDWTHLDDSGASRMVDVGSKPVTSRMARASARLRVAAETLAKIRENALAKGNVLEIARLAGIMAAKRTDQLIPLCHTVPLDGVSIDLNMVEPDLVTIEATVQTTSRTGVEMEALTAVSTAALTVYDMCKAIDRGMVIERIQLEEKAGGRSGHYLRQST